MPLVQPQGKTSLAPDTPKAEEFPPLQPCSRSDFATGLEGWMRITSPKPYPDFDICPDCYRTAFSNTRYAHCITPAPAKPAEIATKCDFSDLWSRIAYAWLFMQIAPDLTIMGSLTELQRDEEGACPNLNLEDPEVQNGGKCTTTRRWYCLRDPTTNKHIEELTVCSDCVAHVNWIFPRLQGIFEPVASGQKLQGTCDLMMLGNGQARFLEYMVCISEVASKTELTGARDVAPLADFLKEWAAIPVCKKGGLVVEEMRWSLASNVPEFTACQECYKKYIQPMLSNSPRSEWLSQLEGSFEPPGQGFMCDLFSPRLQQYFREACATNDVQMYRQKLNARNNKMQEVNMQLSRMKQEYQQLKMQARTHMSMMNVERMRASSANTLWMTTGWTAPPIDWRSTNALMSKANQLDIQAAQVLDNMTLLEKEWNNYWL